MIKKTAGLVIAGLLLAISFQPVVAQATTRATAAAKQPASSCLRLGEGARRIARLTNASRAEAGVGSLKLDPELSRVAAKHSRVMAKHRKLFHTPQDVLAWRVTHWNALGENVGVGGSIRSLQKAFMASPSHRSNVLRSGWEHMGAAVRRSGGHVWVTVVFESSRDPGTRVWMPDCSR
jgi:uncharacterized protein YkwD